MPRHAKEVKPFSADRKQKRIVKSLKWADEVGLALNEERGILETPRAKYGRGVKAPVVEECTSERGGGKSVQLVGKGGKEVLHLGKEISVGQLGLEQPSYKEVLLSHGSKHPSKATISCLVRGWSSFSKSRSSGERWKAGRCFKCLASDHRVAVCRDPVRCRSCWRIGHRARQCKRNFAKEEGKRTMNLNREHRRRGRVTSVKAYVPYTEEFLRRGELRRNALLAVVQPADLGLAPQQTIANALVRRFGGYSHDFFVARYREHDFAIILPSWVSAETLIRRQIITLDEIWLRCFNWGLTGTLDRTDPSLRLGSNSATCRLNAGRRQELHRWCVGSAGLSVLMILVKI